MGLSKKDTGFTLIELIIVLFIIAMASSLALISIGKAKEKATLKDTARRIIITLGFAREKSIMEKANYTFSIDPDSGTYWISRDSEKSSYRQYTVPKGIKINGDQISFFPMGNSSGGKVEVSDEKDRRIDIGVDPVLGKAAVI